MIGKFKIVFIVILFFTTGFSLSAQQATLQGIIRDTLQNPVSFANLIATPTDGQITFAISGEDGKYQLKLNQGISYRLEITHLGHSKTTDTIRLFEDTVKNYTLSTSAETLGEVLIKTEMAVIVQEDTITYRVDNFRTGKERKLRELLKNLPGMEVDRAGNVRVNGKKVTKLLVEGETFFTGDTKLGVNNIPADAVEEVVAIDDYNEVPFLKNLADSDELALNIKLKEGKKKFVFGEIEAGGGIEERYLFHPTLFYYSPKTAVNLIGDFNNIGKKSFTLKDYIDFEGGFSSFLDDPGAYFDLYNSDFARFLSQEDFTFNKNEFGAFSLSQEVSSSVRMTGYSINSIGKTETKTTQQIDYLTGENLSESRISTTDNDLFFSLNKLELDYEPNYQTDLAYDALVKISNGSSLGFIGSKTLMDSTATNTDFRPENVEITQNLEFNKQFSSKHTSTFNLNYTYQKSEDDKEWLFNQPVFSDIMPFVVDGDEYNLLQKTNAETNSANLRLKHYWVLNNFNHIYPIIGFRFHHQTYTTFDYQRLQNGSINNFQGNGFNNDLCLGLIDSYFGFEYKRKLGDLILKPGLVYHYFMWDVSQFSEETTNQSKALFLPKLSVEYEISPGEKFDFDYNFRTGFADVDQYANRLRLVSFNQLYQGNENLENRLYHQFSLRYYKFNLFEGTFINAGINYTNRIKSIQNTTSIEGIDRISTPIYSDLPQNSYSINGSYAKQLGKLKLTIRGNLSLSDYSRVINGETIDYSSENYSYTFKAETNFKKWPNIEIGLNQHFSNFGSKNHDTQFMRLDPYLFLEYGFLKDFILKADYVFNYYENKETGQINRFQIGNASLFYGKEDSLWGFEISVRNLFDIRYKNENSFDGFLVVDRNLYIQPRTILFKINYKL